MSNRRLIMDKVFKIIVTAVSLLGVLPLLHLIASVIVKGGQAILQAGPSFFASTPASPLSNELGGIAPALAGSLILAVSSIAIGVPVAFATGLFLYEFRDTRLARVARVFLMSLLEIPTVLVGILVYVIIVVPMGSHSLLAGGLALAIVILPYVATYVENTMQQVPAAYRKAGFALGLTRAQVALRIVAGIARRGILAGVIVGLSKAVGETAPLLFTVGGARNAVGIDPLEPGDAAPLLIFHFAQTPYENWRLLAWGASLVLVIAVLAVYLASKRIVREVRM